MAEAAIPTRVNTLAATPFRCRNLCFGSIAIHDRYREKDE